ncbi:unnamed protein product [Somion occarium]|uniref:Uncharacterized protein n=1 Tax=Somion occarium TaxID=3059160 RepID=A0ABP1DTQ0_9APHY
MYDAQMDSGRNQLQKRTFKYCTKTVSWEVNQEQCPAPFSGVMYLPLHRHQAHGATKVEFRHGEDLNFRVYQFYNENVDPKTYGGANYIPDDDLVPGRHEYLGLPHR